MLDYENINYDNINKLLDKALDTGSLLKTNSFSVAKMYTKTNDYEILYEFIPDIRYAYILAQYAMEHDRNNTHNELIFIFPGYNNSKLKDDPNYKEFAEALAKEYVKQD